VPTSAAGSSETGMFAVDQRCRYNSCDFTSNRWFIRRRGNWLLTDAVVSSEVSIEPFRLMELIISLVISWRCPRFLRAFFLGFHFVDKDFATAVCITVPSTVAR